MENRIDRIDAQAGHDVNAALSRKGKVRQCLEIQQVLKAVINDPKTKPLELASCVRSWDLIEERLRILRNKPLPGHLQPEERAKKRKVKEPDEAKPMSMPKAA